RAENCVGPSGRKGASEYSAADEKRENLVPAHSVATRKRDSSKLRIVPVIIAEVPSNRMNQKKQENDG
ncbi:MAG: hypothetical protein KF886_26460, partial [Candidatus Hydrogenedentes bacterium]|nr:hypothetical protein [Candidatus Hydrogenedentota bacterium]